MGVIEWLCDIRFHRSLVLPPNPETNRTKPLRVSYADYGDKDSDAVVLFCGALMGMRMCYSPLDQLAKLHRVRIIHPDRPGVGGSDPVTQQERIAIWLEIVPHLLQHLRIPYVSLASHSGGDIYLLNTVLTHPHLLHPKNPYVTFFAPWVHHSHSGVSSLRATELLPAPLIGKFASVARFVNQNVVPLAGLSGTLLHGIRDSFTHSTPAPAPVPLMPTATDGSGTTPVPSRNADNASDLDLNDPKIVEELRMLIVQYLFAEQTEGVSMDAQLFLKKPQTTHWCSPDIFWSDIDDAVPLIKKLIRDEGAAGGGEGRNWMFTSFHAEEDSMVGEKGRTWFDACWTKDADGEPQDDAGDGNGKFRYESKIVPKSDHNYLMDPAFQASNIWLEGVRAAFPPLEEEVLDPETHHDSPSDREQSHAAESNVRMRHLALRARRTMRKFTSKKFESTPASPLSSPGMTPVIYARRSFDDGSTRAIHRGKTGHGMNNEKGRPDWLDKLRI